MASNPKYEVLKKRSDFLSITKFGKKISPTSWLTLNYVRSQKGPRFGWTLSTKVGNAVIRNRLKRWLREITTNDLKHNGTLFADVNVFIRPQSRDFYKFISHEEFKSGFEKGLSSLRQKLG